MMFEVIEPRFNLFIEKVKTKVTSIDDMMKEHISFYEGIFTDCMLTQKHLLNLIVKILQLCIEFAEFILVSILIIFIDESTFNVQPI